MKTNLSYIPQHFVPKEKPYIVWNKRIIKRYCCFVLLRMIAPLHNLALVYYSKRLQCILVNIWINLMSFRVISWNTYGIFEEKRRDKKKIYKFGWKGKL